MFVLKAHIEIGKFKFDGVHEVRIRKSIVSYMDTASIKLPPLCRIKKKRGSDSKEMTAIAQLFKRGDKVKISLGYNDVMNQEFVGFVSRVDGGRPVEIECEGYSFLLREKTINKSYRSTTLKEVLKEIVSGTEIVLDKDIQDIKLSKLNLAVLNGQLTEGVPVLDTLKKALGNILFINFKGNVMYAGLGYTRITDRLKPLKADVVYRLGRNAISDNLKQRIKGDKAVVAITSHKKLDGTYMKAQAGKGDVGVQRIRLQHLEDQQSLKDVAIAKESVDNYSGLEGSITAFLLPYCEPGQKLRFIDPQNAQRNSSLIIDATEVVFSTGGARRIPKVSHAL